MRSVLPFIFCFCLGVAFAQDAKRGDASDEPPRDKIFNSTHPGIRLPRLIRETRPSRPEGSDPTESLVVLLECIVRTSGRADSCRSLRGAEKDFERNAIREIEANWLFQPGTLRNRPVHVRIALEVRFDGSPITIR